MYLWLIKGVRFLQNANNFNFKLFFRLYIWPTKQVFCLNLRRILDNESFWIRFQIMRHHFCMQFRAHFNKFYLVSEAPKNHNRWRCKPKVKRKSASRLNLNFKILTKHSFRISVAHITCRNLWYQKIPKFRICFFGTP